MNSKSIKKLTLSAMMIALGLVLPFITGGIPEIGNMLLPMHLPVFLSGLISGYGYGLAVGFILPILRSLIFSMPVLFPRAVAMAFELAVYGGAAGAIYGVLKKKSIITLYISLLSAMILGRGVWGAVTAVLLGFAEQSLTMNAFIASAFTTAIPGIIAQLILIPAIMAALGEMSVGSMPHLSITDRIKLKKTAEKIINYSKERCTGASVLISIDGRCASGKTSLGKYLSKISGVSVVHADDFFLPPDRKTKERLSEPGGNIDYERLESELLMPLKSCGEATYHPFSCKRGEQLESVTVKSDVVVVEGVYSQSKNLEPYYDLKVFIEIDPETQKKRLLRRAKKPLYDRFIREWIPLEEHYFEIHDPKSRADLIFTL